MIKIIQEEKIEKERKRERERKKEKGGGESHLFSRTL